MTNSVAPYIILAALTLNAAYQPPRPPPLARALSGAQIARVISAAPATARVGVPIRNLRPWSATAWQAGDTCHHAGAIYCCIQGHTALDTWTPSATPALWRHIRNLGESGPPAWRQPLGAHDAYAKGAIVRHADKLWRSTIDNNVWAPGVYGWEPAN